MSMAILSATGQTKLTLHVNEATKTVSPTLYGLMTEEINYSYEGGLYAQLLRNSTMKETTKPWNPYGAQPMQPKYWELTDTLNTQISVAYREGINRANNMALSVTTRKAGVGIINKGYFGIPILPSTTYKGAMYIKGGSHVTLLLESDDNKTIFAQTTVNNITNDWKKFDITFVTDKQARETKEAHFKIVFDEPGSYKLAQVTLFPPTYNNRPNGMRRDLMSMMKEMKPKFLRFPGGNYLEGGKFCERFDWKKTIGPIDGRPGHASPWGYWSTDGMGLLEFMQWAEDVGAEPLLAVFAGYTLNGDYVDGANIKPFAQDALDEIEYVIGGADTKWGAQRIKDGHPAPFPLHYVEIGNEDFFDHSGSYPDRYQQIYDAIKAKYPQLQLISTMDAKSMTADALHPEQLKWDIVDEHYYRNAADMYRAAFQYDKYDRKGPKIFCGEWATREGKPTTNMNAALGDAAWMTCMERNSDLVMAACYAPLFVNVSPGGMQWESDLIGYDALKAYGSPSYYAQVMFSSYLGNKIVPISGDHVPSFSLSDKKGDTAPELYYVATKDSQKGHIYLKVVNAVNKTQKVQIALEGIAKLASTATKIELKAAHPEDTNTLENPTNIVPVSSKVKVGKNAKYTLSPYSITIFQFEIK